MHMGKVPYEMFLPENFLLKNGADSKDLPAVKTAFYKKQAIL